MQRRTIGGIWLFGLALALGLYVVGPDRFVQAGLDLAAQAQAALAGLVVLVTVDAFDLVRSLAIALFVVFLVLGILAAQRGLRARGALAVVSLLFLACIHGGDGASGNGWLGAFVLAAVGAAVMTRRLVAAPAAHDPWVARRL